MADGYLLIPAGRGPFPAVFVPFYEPLTSIGAGKKGQGTHDYGLQLVRRGFVTLSIGTPGSVEKIGLDTRQLLVEAGARQRRQPLTLLAYVAANCHTALAQMPPVDPQRIGIIGLSYGGKWSTDWPWSGTPASLNHQTRFRVQPRTALRDGRLMPGAVTEDFDLDGDRHEAGTSALAGDGQDALAEGGLGRPALHLGFRSFLSVSEQGRAAVLAHSRET